MASQGTKVSFSELKEQQVCSFRGCNNQATYNFTCSPNFFELSSGYICDDHKKKCEECAAKNGPVKSDLDY